MTALTSPEIDRRTRLFQDLLTCVGQHHYWSYSPSGRLLSTNCTDLILDKVFRYTSCYTYMMDYARTGDRPLVMSEPYGLLWVAVFERNERRLVRVHILGPVYAEQPDRQSQDQLLKNALAPESVRVRLIRNLRSIQVLPPSRLLQQAVQLHFCVTGEQIQAGDFAFQKETAREEELSLRPDTQPQPHYAEEYRALQGFMRMIKEGNLEYKQYMRQSLDYSFESSQVISSPSGTLMNTKVNQIIFTSCCKQSAIDGGLSTEKACGCYKTYIQKILNARTVSEVLSISNAMYDEFIRLVHNVKNENRYSKAIQSCCDYIETHLYERMELSDIASRIGYADYYLSRRFKQETGMSINDYVKKAKIEQSKILLTDTKKSIQEISDVLCFGSRAFFARTFRELTGSTPAAYRKKLQPV